MESNHQNIQVEDGYLVIEITAENMLLAWVPYFLFIILDEEENFVGNSWCSQ